MQEKFICGSRLAAYFILKHQPIIDIFKDKKGKWKFVFNRTSRLEELIWNYKHLIREEDE